MKTPSNKAKVAAARGAVIIATRLGSVTVTPELARQIASQLPRMANLADGFTQEQDELELDQLLNVAAEFGTLRGERGAVVL